MSAPVDVTAETVTAGQIRELRDSFDEGDDPDLALACDRALGLDSLDDCTEDERLGIIDTSRARAVVVINTIRHHDCCPHPVERHAYNGCADCGCAVRWVEHPGRMFDTSPDEHTRAAIAAQVSSSAVRK